MIEAKEDTKPPPREAMKACPKPLAWGEFITEPKFEALDGEGKVNAVFEYTTKHVFGALGECNKRHNALVEYVKEVHQ